MLQMVRHLRNSNFLASQWRSRRAKATLSTGYVRPKHMLKVRNKTKSDLREEMSEIKWKQVAAHGGLV